MSCPRTVGVVRPPAQEREYDTIFPAPRASGATREVAREESENIMRNLLVRLGRAGVLACSDGRRDFPSSRARRSASAVSRICRSAANWHSRSPAFRSASAFAASRAADSARTARTSASSARMRSSPAPTPPDAPVGVSGAFSPKNDKASSPPTAFVFGNGFISSTGAHFLNIPLESCEKSVYVLPIRLYVRSITEYVVD